MTQIPPPEPPRVALFEIPERLTGLLAEYDQIAAEQRAVKARYDSITKAIKLVATQLVPDEAHIDLVVPGQTYHVDYRPGWKIDTQRLKAEQPHVYAAYAKQSGSWYLTKG